MIEISKQDMQAADKAAKANGRVVDDSTQVLDFFVREGLPLGRYTPENSVQRVYKMQPRRAGGREWRALPFVSATGRTYDVGAQGFYNTIRVIDADPDTIERGAKWEGEEVQPTHEIYRYGKANAPTGKQVEGKVYYACKPFELVRKVVQVVPRFPENGDPEFDANRQTQLPIFDEQCNLSVVSAVAEEQGGI